MDHGITALCSIEFSGNSRVDPLLNTMWKLALFCDLPIQEADPLHTM